MTKMNAKKSSISIFKKITIIGLIDSIISIFVVAIGALLIIQVASRYLFHFPYSWPEETACFIFTWLTCLGVPSAYEKNQLFKITIFKEKLFHISFQKVLGIITNIIVLLCLIVMVTKGVNAVRLGANRKTASLRIPYSYIYSALPVGFSLLSINVIKKILNK